MSEFLDKCEEFFATRDFYEILNIKRDASEKELKKAYHKLSLLVHPDRVDDSQKLIATEKFKVLGKIHSILQDADKRKVYDECGDFDEESFDSSMDWLNYWRAMFRKITNEDIEKYEREYKGSEQELRDIKKAYVGCKDNMDKMMEMIPFCDCDSEPRIMEIVQKMVDNDEVEYYDAYFNESQRKKDRRRKKWDAEKEEVENAKLTQNDLQKEIEQNIERRQSEFLGFLSKLEDKYSNKGSKRKAIASPTKKKAKVSENKPTKTSEKRSTRSSNRK